MLGLAVMILSVAIVKGFQIEIKEKVRGFSGDIIVVKYDLNTTFENSPFIINPKTIRNILSYPTIAAGQAYATKPAIININDEVEGVIMKGIDKTYDQKYLKKILVAGTFLGFSDSVKASQQLLISRYTAERLNLKVGDDFKMYFLQKPLRARKFTIVGIFNLGIEEIDKTYVIGDISIIRRLNNWTNNEIGGYELRLKNFDQLDTVAETVYHGIGMKLKSYSVKEYYPEVFQWLSLLDVNTEVLLILMVAVAVINMISALLIIILERANMIGILKALGSTNWEIRKVFLYNAVYLIGFGLFLGNILGIGLATFQKYTHFFTLDQASYYITFIPVELNIVDIGLLNLGTLVICVFVLIVPSMLVSRISPVKAISFK